MFHYQFPLIIFSEAYLSEKSFDQFTGQLQRYLPRFLSFVCVCVSCCFCYLSLWAYWMVSPHVVTLLVLSMQAKLQLGCQIWASKGPLLCFTVSKSSWWKLSQYPHMFSEGWCIAWTWHAASMQNTHQPFWILDQIFCLCALPDSFPEYMDCMLYYQIFY